MEESLNSDFISAAEDLESSPLNVDEGKSKNSPWLDKHDLSFPPTSDSICILETPEHIEVGRYYELYHSNLPPNCPAQIKCVRIAMVSDKGEHQLSLRYPSLHSLRTHFSDQNFEKPGWKKTPALDEKYMMGIEYAIKTLYKSIPTEEFAQKRNTWSFWVSPSKENNRNIDNPEINEAITSLVSKQGSCWSELKFTGMMQWGQRRQVRFLGRHEEQKDETLQEHYKGKGVRVVELEHREEGTNGKKRKEVAETEGAVKVAASWEVMRMTRQCKKNPLSVSGSSEVRNIKKAKNDTKKQKLMIHGKNKRKITIDRWSADRYHLAEENMLKVMKAKGAVFGNPILRPDLRSEARKHIGDTGLLDHLLKHMAGKVAPGGAERFRRRHNAEGAMEYWLENADLVDIRKEAGVQDPYWTPPPGWKPGDSTLPDHVSSKELREIKDEMLKLKREMLELASKKEEQSLAVVTTTPSSCFSSLISEEIGSPVSKQEIYAELLSKKAKIEEQLKEISLALRGMEEQMRMLPIMSDSDPVMSVMQGPTSLTENVGGETRDEENNGNNDNKAIKSEDIRLQGNRTAEEKAAKIERLKSGFIICKPQGTFMWPNIIGVFTHVEEQTVVPTPTPTSASSSTTKAPKSTQEDLPILLPSPPSPVKPLAKRRPVSTATLTHVTGPFSPHLSSPSGNPRSTVIKINTKNVSSINLNEAPLNHQE